jgi:hypothetical protein
VITAPSTAALASAERIWSRAIAKQARALALLALCYEPPDSIIYAKWCDLGERTQQDLARAVVEMRELVK